MFPLINRYLRFLAVFCILVVIFYLIVSSPKDFPVNKLIYIERGLSLNSIASVLAKNNTIHDAFIFSAFVLATGGDTSLKAGTYVFSEKKGLFSLITALREGDFGKGEIKITFPEGYSNKEIARRLNDSLPNINEAFFLESANAFEGELFPDTYFFNPEMTVDDIITTMHENFLTKTNDLFENVSIVRKNKKDTIIMASILEKEAAQIDDQKIIAGILWKRLKNDMLLQVDATLSHVVNRNTFYLTNADLATSSPYNTYKYKGLPPKPIGNPGISALEAALSYTETPYWFYLSDYQGVMHYSKTYKEHKEKKALYLD